MARKSATVKALEESGTLGEFIPARPDPLEGLTREQRDEWKAVVDRMPEEWFPRETHQLLAQYCRHACEAKFISGMLRAHKVDPETSGEWLDQYGDLLKLQEREGRAMSSLATRLRITQQSTVNPKIQKPSEPVDPWD